MRFLLFEKTSLWFFKNSIFGAPVDIAEAPGVYGGGAPVIKLK
jgi:hypothetical protein